MANDTSGLELHFDEVRCLNIPLTEKLASHARWLRLNKPEVMALYSDLVKRLEASVTDKPVISVGSPMPPFLLPDTEGRLVSSKELLKAGPLVVSFNRGYWCPFCKLELLELGNVCNEIRRLGGEIVSITPQRAPAGNLMRELCALPFPVLCDIDNSYALACGLMYLIGDAMGRSMREVGLNVGADQGNKGLFLPIPATFVVDRSGIILTSFVDFDFTNRMPSQQIVETLQRNAIG